jgi:ABC-2 type transport system permease protein
MRLAVLFKALFKKEIIYLKRYYFNTISSIITIYIIFLIIFFGVKALGGGGGTPSPSFGDTLSGIVVGFIVWTFALFAYSDLSWAMIQEAQQGTLEQLYMSPLGFGWVSIFRIASGFIISTLINVLLLILMMASSGRWLHIDVISIAPLLLLTIAGVYGIGFLMGGLALIFKRVQATFQILQFVFVALIAVPLDRFEFLKYLPLSFGTRLIAEVMIAETSIFELPLEDLLFLVINSMFYFGLGFLAFKFLEGVARDRGLLGHY